MDNQPLFTGTFMLFSKGQLFEKEVKQNSTNKPTQKTTHKSQETLDCLLLPFLLYFLVQEREAGIYAASYFLWMGLTVNGLLKDSLSSAFQIWV